jgi:hypothetical protein
MSIHSRILIAFGMTLVVPLGITVGNRVDADEPPRAGGPMAQARAGSSTPERFLLLINGRILQGVVSESETEYQLTQRIGVLKFPRSRVEGVFASIQEIYQYKLQQLPERDSEERMKLAHWCLNHQMTREARDQLSQVVALNPKNQQAQAMLVSIDQASRIAEMRQRDPDVQRTRADRPAGERPATLDSSVIRGAQSALRISDSPVIFDLPRPVAVARTTEFVKYVHPLLQAYCAKCHNENYNGAFQLIQFKSRADQTTDALRANLDATLRLVDPENLSRSDLLSSTLRPHGRGPNKRPIFPGSNDRAYQILAGWVSKLRAPKPPGVTAMQERPRLDNEQSEVFAAHRERISTEQPESSLPRPQQPRSAPLGVVVPGEQGQTSPREFPLPFVISGAKPAISQGGMQPPEAARPAAKPTGNNPSRPTGATMARDADKPIAPSDPKRSADPGIGEGADLTAKKPSKPLKLDPSLLQKVLQSRNASH